MEFSSIGIAVIRVGELSDDDSSGIVLRCDFWRNVLEDIREWKEEIVTGNRSSYGLYGTMRA